MATKSKSSSKSSRSKRAPWRKTAPKRSRHSKLTKGQKSKAKAAAKRAGRRYPNLVDNMRVASSTKQSRSKPKRPRTRRKS
jgi:hypothetical protein